MMVYWIGIVILYVVGIYLTLRKMNTEMSLIENSKLSTDNKVKATTDINAHALQTAVVLTAVMVILVVVLAWMGV